MGDNNRLFEKICLEVFRAAFAGFDMETVAAFDETDVKRLVLDVGIVRHRGKIVSTINNAHRAIEMRQEFGSLATYFWAFEPVANSRPQHINCQTLSGITTSPESIALSKDLHKRGQSLRCRRRRLVRHKHLLNLVLKF